MTDEELMSALNAQMKEMEEFEKESVILNSKTAVIDETDEAKKQNTKEDCLLQIRLIRTMTAKPLSERKKMVEEILENNRNGDAFPEVETECLKEMHRLDAEDFSN